MFDTKNTIGLVQKIAIVVILIFYILVVIYFTQGNNQNDFAIFYYSAQNFFEGKNIYFPIPLEKIGEISPEIKSILRTDSFFPNLNPPFQTLLFLPFTFINLQRANLVWAALSLMFGLISARIIANNQPLKPVDKRSFLMPVIMLFAFFPTLAAFKVGQISLLILLLVVAGWSASRAGKDRAAGIFLGLALSLKLFIGLFIIFFLIRRRWKLLAWYIGTFLATSFLALFVFGIDAYRQYIVNIRDITWYEHSWNVSFTGFFTRLFGGTDNISFLNWPEMINIVVFSLSLISVIILIWVAWPRYGLSSAIRFDLGYALTLVFMLLISPLGWIYYFPLLFLPAILILWISTRWKNQFLKALVISLWVLMTIWPFLPRTQVNVFYNQIYFGFYSYVLLAFGVMLVWLILSLDRGQIEPL